MHLLKNIFSQNKNEFIKRRFKDEEKVPPQIKTTIIGALGYFIAPLDFIPDLAPFIGLTDDITALGSAYMLAQIYATPEVREKAERKRDEMV